MAGNKGHVETPPLSRSLSRGPSTSQKSLARRVSFSENHILGNTSRAHDDIEGARRGRGTCWTCCNMCCAWASILIWTLVILVLIVGVAFFAFVQSNLPEVKVQRLDIHHLNVTNSTSKETQLNLELEFLINVTNKNHKLELSYGAMNVESKIEAFDLQKAHVSAFQQDPRTSNPLKIRTGLSGTVNEDDAKELEWEADRHEMVFSVKMTGMIQFLYHGKKMSELHLKILCQDIDQSVVDQALGPKCNVKLSPFGR